MKEEKSSAMTMKYSLANIAFPLRLTVFAACAAAGMALQILITGGAGIFVGLLVMIPGLAVVWAKNFKNKPMDIGQESWQAASVHEFDRIKSNIQMTRQRNYAVIYSNRFGWFIAIVLAALAIVFRSGDLRLPALISFDALVLLLPFLFTGNVTLWTPQELAFKLRAYEPILSTEQAEGGDIVITPYLRLDKDKEGHQIPEDVRLMVEPRRKPADFLGVQLQIAINNGPNGKVPYMYSVFLCKGKGETFHALSKEDFGRYVKEPGGDTEYGYVVVRQPTSGTGYNTTDADVHNLYNLVKDKLTKMMKR